MRQVETVIIGAGLGGIAAAMALRRRGREDFLLLDRDAGPGGVWRVNTYPGAACDVPSPYYSYAEHVRTDWPRRYSTQPAILDYVHRVVEAENLSDRIVTGTEVVAADWDEDALRWIVTAADGRKFSARFLIPALGQLSTPAPIPIPGADDFTGPSFHTARWNHDVDLVGKKVAVIGTGASAVQVIAAIADEVDRLTVFQRSAPYLLSRLDQIYSPRAHRLFARAPILVRVERLFWWTLAELWTFSVLGNPISAAVFRTWSSVQRRIQVRDKALRAKITPTEPMGCKRVLFSSDYYPALQRDNVELVTTAITEVTADGVETEDGAVHPADVIVYATGFDAQHFGADIAVRGIGGTLLADQWAGGARAYLGIAVPGFPNMALIYGPNTNLGTGSIIYMMQRQARYIAAWMDRLDADGVTAAAVRPEIEQAYDEDVQKRLAGTVWARCTNWYRTRDGRITSNWPRTVSAYDRTLARVDPADYRKVG